MKAKGGSLALLADHLNLRPPDAPDAGTQGLNGGLLSRKSGSQSGNLSTAEVQLLVGVDAVKKAVSPARHDALDALDFDNVYAGDKHLKSL